MGSISNQSIAGMISTAAHGYGFNFACYSSMVTHLVLVLGDGTVARCSPTEDADLFRATLCGLGATGIIVEVGLQCEGDYRLEEETFGMEVDDYVKAIEGADGTPNSGIFASAEHVRTYYYPQVGKIRVQRANRTKRVRLRLVSGSLR